MKLPKLITLTNNRWIKITYAANGQVLKRTYSTGEFWEYDGGLVYKNGVPYQLSTPEGRATYTSNVWNYEYVIKDHLGNTRISFKANGTNPQLIDNTDFDPFGIELNGTGVNNPIENRFKYQNKETLALFGLNGINDFGARFLDKTTGRWWGIDPLSEISRRFSPYVYSNDNPLRFIDPDGMASQSVQDFNGRWHQVGDDEKTTIYQSQGSESQENQQDDQSAVSRSLYNIMLQDWTDKNLNCSSSYACYPATWKRLEKAYGESSGSIPKVFNTTWSKSYRNSNRIYPDLNTIFGILFGSDNQNPLWGTIPIEHRGKGVAGAMVYAGLGEYANVVGGELKRASVVQLWNSQKTFEMVRDGVDISKEKDAIGHAIIFMWYLPDKSGFKFIDQSGTGTALFQGTSVYFGANLLDEKK